jgi:hypothetical protein
VALDVAQPVTVEDRTLLHVAQAALAGDLEPLHELIGTIETTIRTRANGNLGKRRCRV